MTGDHGCPGGCSYIKDGSDKSQIWCFTQEPFHIESQGPYRTNSCYNDNTIQISTKPPPTTPGSGGGAGQITMRTSKLEFFFCTTHFGNNSFYHKVLKYQYQTFPIL